MRVAVLGASGNIGSAVVNKLSHNHDVIKIGSRTGDHVVDYTDPEALDTLFVDYTDPEALDTLFVDMGTIDAIVVSVGGDSHFKPYGEIDDDDFRFAAERKLVAQFRLVRLAEKFVSPNGSVTLTSGFLSHYPIGVSLATGPFNAAIDTFVRQAAPHLGNGLRLNVVSPAQVVEPAQVAEGLVSAVQVAELYAQSVEGTETGTVFRAWGGLPVPQT